MAIKLKISHFRVLVEPLLILVAILFLLLIVEPSILGSIVSQIKSPFSQSTNKIQQVNSNLPQETKLTLSDDGKWKWSNDKNDWIPNTKSNTPSERALKVASLFYTYSNEKQRNETVKTYSGKNGYLPEAIKNMALFLDEEPEKIILAEAVFEKIARNESRPNITLPSVQQPSVNFPKNCTSNTIGDYTYTNCY